MNTTNTFFGRDQMDESHPKTMTQFQVYQNLNFVSDLHFKKGRITIGSNHNADLFLDHRSVAGIHALVDVKEGKAILTNQFPENGLRLNGEPVLKARLQPEDVIAIGPFALKIKKAGHTNPSLAVDDASYCVCLINQYNSRKARETASVNLAKLLRLDIEKATSLIERDHFIIKKGASGPEAAQIQNTMLKAGVICVVQWEEKQHSSSPMQMTLPIEPAKQTVKSLAEETPIVQTIDEEEREKTLESSLIEEYDEEEDEEDLWEAPFSLENELRPSYLNPLPQPADKIDTISWRHWAVSLGIHFAFLFIFVVYTAIQTATPEKQPLHFVQIDRSMLEKVEPPRPKVIPKKKPTQKIEPKNPVKKAKDTKTKSQSKRKASANKIKKAKKPGKKTVRASKATKHPNAGGGLGEGNIKNRNINQTGLLSVLGGTSPAGTSKAMVAVTNLDAVKVPGATEKNFSVGGLKGALGNGSIAVASGPIVQTKGSSQVLRSAGAGGKGEVAALARGTTGKKKVQAMVTAKMNRTVKIEGGMSREMVKKVIDQHLDEITYCYETALMANPSILGRVVFEWKILKNGRVGQVRIVSSSVNSNQIHGCIKSAIQSWQFPKPVGTEVIVSYPFVFDLVSF